MIAPCGELGVSVSELITSNGGMTNIGNLYRNEPELKGR